MIMLRAVKLQLPGTLSVVYKSVSKSLQGISSFKRLSGGAHLVLLDGLELEVVERGLAEGLVETVSVCGACHDSAKPIAISTGTQTRRMRYKPQSSTIIAF
jgi:hypothetical protein